MKRALGAVILGVTILLATGTVQAVPILQLYIEGAWYDQATESWVAAPSGSSGGGSFKLWAIGNVNGPGGAGTISHVRLAVSYSVDSEPMITLTPSTASEEELDILRDIANATPEQLKDDNIPEAPFSTYKLRDWKDDSSLPDDWYRLGIPTSNDWWGDDDGEDEDVVTDGSWPLLSSGKELPTHGSFGDGVSWQEFYLGNFTEHDEPIADFIPPEGYTGDYNITSLQEVFATGGQVNVYDVTVDGASEVHFDLYNHVGSDNKAKAKFAPFSHDAHIVPEPASLAVWLLLGVLGITVGRWRRSRSVV